MSDEYFDNSCYAVPEDFQASTDNSYQYTDYYEYTETRQLEQQQQLKQQQQQLKQLEQSADAEIKNLQNLQKAPTRATIAQAPTTVYQPPAGVTAPTIGPAIIPRKRLERTADEVNSVPYPEGYKPKPQGLKPAPNPKKHPDAMPYRVQKQPTKINKKLAVRAAGGQVWEDKSMALWDENDYRLFCGNLGNEVNQETLAMAFRKYASFQQAHVVRDKRTGKTRGYGFISFSNPDDFVKAMREMNGKYVGNRPILLRKSNWKDRIADDTTVQYQKALQDAAKSVTE